MIEWESNFLDYKINLCYFCTVNVWVILLLPGKINIVKEGDFPQYLVLLSNIALQITKT